MKNNNDWRNMIGKIVGDQSKKKKIYLSYYCSVCEVVIPFFSEPRLAAIAYEEKYKVGYCQFCNVERTFEKITDDD